MFQPCKFVHLFPAGWRQAAIALTSGLLLAVGAAAQEPLATPWQLDPNSVVPAGVPIKGIFSQAASHRVTPATPAASDFVWNGNIFGSAHAALRPDFALAGPQRLTLQQAQQQAAGGTNPLARLGQLQVEAAKQNRLAARGDYFPKISATLLNMHMNKHPGEILAVGGRISGQPTSVAVNIVHKDMTLFNVGAVQPITPLLSVRELVKIAKADENIARAKAGMAVSAPPARVEKTYFALLIAQRELTIAEAKVERVQNKYLIASTSSDIPIPAEKEAEILGAEKTVVLAESKVRELSASLNGLLGWPAETQLELVAPLPLADGITLEQASQQAMEANPAVVEAEQTAIKARAGHKLTKLQYVPVVAAMGGYVRQSALNVIIPRDFSYYGFVASFDVFDGGKREHNVKKLAAQSEAAELGVQLTKAKVAESVKKTYFEMTRSRDLSLLSQRMLSASQVVNAGYEPDTPEVKEAKATLEVEMFKAELAHREASARLRELMGDR